MTSSLKRDWRKGSRAIEPGVKYRQVAALCWRRKGKSKQVLLITSRESGRWIIPKGWPMEGKTAVAAAVQEAWEEAGVEPSSYKKKHIGKFTYNKILADGSKLPIEAKVFPVEVSRLAKRFPEMDERKRKWVKAEIAAEMVRETGLQQILRDF